MGTPEVRAAEIATSVATKWDNQSVTDPKALALDTMITAALLAFGTEIADQRAEEIGKQVYGLADYKFTEMMSRAEMLADAVQRLNKLLAFARSTKATP